MGLFSRKPDPQRELAEAIVKRGVRVRGRVESFEATGPDARVSVSFTTEDGSRRLVAVEQSMAPPTQVGLEEGEPVELSYDRDDPDRVLIWGSPKYRVDESGAVVRVVDLEGGERG